MGEPVAPECLDEGKRVASTLNPRESIGLSLMSVAYAFFQFRIGVGPTPPGPRKVPIRKHLYDRVKPSENFVR